MPDGNRKLSGPFPADFKFLPYGDRFEPSMLKMRSPKVPAMVERAASSDTLKKYLAVGSLAMDLISLIRLSVSILFLM